MWPRSLHLDAEPYALWGTPRRPFLHSLLLTLSSSTPRIGHHMWRAASALYVVLDHKEREWYMDIAYNQHTRRLWRRKASTWSSATRSTHTSLSDVENDAVVGDPQRVRCRTVRSAISDYVRPKVHPAPCAEFQGRGQGLSRRLVPFHAGGTISMVQLRQKAPLRVCTL